MNKTKSDKDETRQNREWRLVTSWYAKNVVKHDVMWNNNEKNGESNIF